MRPNQTIKYFAALLFAALFTATGAHAQLGKVYGKVKDGDETLPMTRVELRDGETVLQITGSDMDGNYELARIEPGQYQLVVISGEVEQPFGLLITPGGTEIKDLVLGGTETVRIWDSEKPLFSVEPSDPVTVTRREIVESGLRDPEDIIASFGSVYQADPGDPLNIKGGRTGALMTIQDGMKLVGPSDVPARAINQITLLDSGIPAEYGDLTSGVLIINTYNPGMRGFKGKPMTRQERKELRKSQKRPKKDSRAASYNDVLALGN